MSLFDTGIRPVVDKWLLDKAAEERDYGDYWSASSAGYCMRKVIFDRLGVPSVENGSEARKQRVFTSGHIFHEWMQGITKESGLSIAQELRLQDEELMIRGHIDDLVLVGENIEYPVYAKEKDKLAPTQVATEQATLKHLILYDYKTQNSRAFSYKRENMSHYHKMQLGTYMYMLRNGAADRLYGDSMFGGTPITRNLTEARILKISKDDLRMTEEQLMWTPDLEKEVVGYWRTLNGYWRDKKLPKCTCADYEGGFLAKPTYNNYYYEDEPCSLKWYELKKKEGLLK